MRVAAFILAVVLAGCETALSSRSMPRDPVHDAVYARLGEPDRVTGSGRSFLHYDLSNGQTVTLIISGGRITGAETSATTRGAR